MNGARPSDQGGFGEVNDRMTHESRIAVVPVSCGPLEAAVGHGCEWTGASKTRSRSPFPHHALLVYPFDFAEIGGASRANERTPVEE